MEDLKAGASVRGLAPHGPAKIVHIEWFGDQAVKVTFEDHSGSVRNRLVFRNEEPTLELVTAGRPWSFDGDGALLRLVSEAYRICLAHLFDPYLAIHTSRIEPLPHQITAVYGEMLPRQPLRFLLADDPGAGKTIMAGLLIKELLIRGDLERCLIVAPGNLVEQWQDELSEKFGLPFDILTRDQVEAARTGNPFAERNLLIARLDMLSRNPDLQERLKAAKDWDLIVCDEAADDDEIRALFYLEHAVQDGRIGRNGQQQVISQRLQFVEVKADGATLDAGPAPYLDYRPVSETERTLIQDQLKADWLAQDLETQVMTHAVTRIVPRHVEELRARRLPEIDKVELAVSDRLKREIIFWDHRAEELKAQERAGKQTRLSSANAAARANELADRLQRRLAELNHERDISALPPVIRGGAGWAAAASGRAEIRRYRHYAEHG